MTDTPSTRALVDKAFAYLGSLTKECRKAVSAKFEREYKGMPFSSNEPTLRKEIEAWFADRDKSVTVKHEKSSDGKPGEIIITYTGTTKDAHFKFQVGALFTPTGASRDAPAYLKNMIINVDKRDFSK